MRNIIVVDYYLVLNVPRDASATDIRSAYRQAALRYHPDHNPGNAEAERKFKDAAEAYETLRDPARRAEYDRLWKEELGQAPQYQSPGSKNIVITRANARSYVARYKEDLKGRMSERVEASQELRSIAINGNLDETDRLEACNALIADMVERKFLRSLEFLLNYKDRLPRRGVYNIYLGLTTMFSEVITRNSWFDNDLNPTIADTRLHAMLKDQNAPGQIRNNIGEWLINRFERKLEIDKIKTIAGDGNVPREIRRSAELALNRVLKLLKRRRDLRMPLPKSYQNNPTNGKRRY